MASFTIKIYGPPRTKKNHQQVVMRGRYPVVLPSEQYQKWFKDSMVFVPNIKRKLRDAGVVLPLAGPLSVKALFFRDADRGDLCGYEQALSDFLQEPRIAKTGKRKGNTIRNGAGIIQDDVQIRSWDGSRLLKDPDKPRIEVTIEFGEDLLSRV